MHLTFPVRGNIISTRWRRGVAQLVACLVRDQEAAGSSPATPTKKRDSLLRVSLFAEVDEPAASWRHASPVAAKRRGDGANRREWPIPARNAGIGHEFKPRHSDQKH